MNTANRNRAVSGFGMALAAMGATQADAEIVSLSFGGSPAVMACNGFCTSNATVTASWSGGGFAMFGFYHHVNFDFNSQILAADVNNNMLGFKDADDVVNGATSTLASMVPFSTAVGDRYLGFNATGNLNGWVKVNFAGNAGGTRTITFLEGAIQTTAGTAITVGDTGLTPVPVPPMLPAMGLAVLAMGAAGVRRSRKAA